MKDRKYNAIAVNFNTDEASILSQAAEIAGMREGTMVRVLAKKYIVLTYRDEPNINLSFDINKSPDLKTAKTLIVKFDEQSYDVIVKISKNVHITPSNFIKYFIMPKLIQIVSEEGGNRCLFI